MSEKANMSMVPKRKMVAEYDGDGNLVKAEQVVGVPQPFTYVDDNGEVREGIKVVKDVDQSRPGEWWWKVMLSDLLDLLEDISGKQTQALRAILAQFDPHSGIVIVSQKELAEQAHCSLNTVNKVIKMMIKHDLIRMPKKGVYTINPAFMSQGGARRFNALWVQYQDSGKPVLPADDEIIDIGEAGGDRADPID